MGAFGLALATVGLAGVTAYSVSSRVHEIGIRLALGARSIDILRMIMAEGATLIVIGSCIGISLAVLLMHVMAANMDPVAQSIQHSRSDLRIAEAPDRPHFIRSRQLHRNRPSHHSRGASHQYLDVMQQHDSFPPEHRQASALPSAGEPSTRGV